MSKKLVVPEFCRRFVDLFRESVTRQILVQSSILVLFTMGTAYIYGRASLTPAQSVCPPSVTEGRYLPRVSPCDQIPAVFTFPESWHALLLVGSVGTAILGVVSALFVRSVFSRYLLVGWFFLFLVLFTSGYLTYSRLGEPPGRFLLIYPATTYVSLGVAVACIFAIANILLRVPGGILPKKVD